MMLRTSLALTFGLLALSANAAPANGAAIDASVKSINVVAGAAFKKGKKTTYYITVPKKCPAGGFPLKSELSFLGGATASAEYKAPCPKK